MSNVNKDARHQTDITLPSEKLKEIRRRRWKKRMQIRATRIKRQIQLENRFHQAMSEMRTTGDRYRKSYLHWIMHHMFTLFDYETGLQAINDKSAYRSWLSSNGYSDVE